MRSFRWASSSLTSVLIRGGHLDTQGDTGDAFPKKKDHWGHLKKVAICRPKRKASIETNLLRPWAQVSSLQHWEKINTILGCFVMAALGNQYTSLNSNWIARTLSLSCPSDSLGWDSVVGEELKVTRICESPEKFTQGPTHPEVAAILMPWKF